MSHRLYRGDIVIAAQGSLITRGVIRDVSGDIAKVQLGREPAWVSLEQLRWDGGAVASRLPRTEWGWRRLARAVS